MILVIEIESGPPAGLGVRASCQAPDVAGCCVETPSGTLEEFSRWSQRIRASSSLISLHCSPSLVGLADFVESRERAGIAQQTQTTAKRAGPNPLRVKSLRINMRLSSVPRGPILNTECGI